MNFELEGGLKRELGNGGEDGFTFEELYASLVFFVSIWVGGKVFNKLLGMPALVGEIVFGILLGPYGFDYVPKVGCFKMIGELGLMLLVVEAGLDVDLEMLRVVGLRGVIIAVFGSMVPLGLGYLIGSTAMGLDTKGAFVIGAAVAPTSMGIALNVLRAGKILNTPVGQLIIAAAVLDDIIALVLLSELQALDDPSAWAFLKPIVVALGLLVGFGAFAVFVIPKLMTKVIYPRVPESLHENVTLALIFGLTLGLAPLAKVAGSSYLLGCFIAGVCFCTNTIVHHVWISQVKRILSWLLRIFFAATIGFEIPISTFVDPKVIGDAMLVMICIIGKLLTGFFAKPLKLFDALVISSAMSAWGEFAFIVILYGKSHELVDGNTVASVILAILISVIVAPICLRFTINYFTRKAKKELEKAARETNCKGVNGDIPLYYFIQSKSRGGFGQQDRLLRVILEADLQIVDMRSFHPRANNFDSNIITEMYLKDRNLALPVDEYRFPHGKNEQEIQKKLKELHDKIAEALHDQHAIVQVGRWFAGLDDSSEISSEDMEESGYLLARELLLKSQQQAVSIGVGRMGDTDDVDEPTLAGFVNAQPHEVDFGADQYETEIVQV